MGEDARDLFSADETPREANDAEGTAAEAVSEVGDDSATFSRCMGCRHAEDVDVSAGTLLCNEHNMRINAEADEIPDDCTAYEPKADETG